MQKISDQAILLSAICSKEIVTVINNNGDNMKQHECPTITNRLNKLCCSYITEY